MKEKKSRGRVSPLNRRGLYGIKSGARMEEHAYHKW